jgi:hypothetical protein
MLFPAVVMDFVPLACLDQNLGPFTWDRNEVKPVPFQKGCPLQTLKSTPKGPYRPDAIWQRDANSQFSMTFNFNIFQCFSNILNHLSNFSYLVCICCKIFIRWRFYLFLKTENSCRVAESRPVCVGLKAKTPSAQSVMGAEVSSLELNVAAICEWIALVTRYLPCL